MTKKISSTSSIDIAQILSNHWQHVGPRDSFEGIAQSCIEELYHEFADSIVLTRMFLTVPFAGLPDANRQWVEGLAKKTDVYDLLGDKVPVLSLVGTAGGQDSWSDRRKSEGHVGIPLVSSAFIQAIPMMMRLMGQVTGGLDWLDTRDRDMQKRIMGRFSGTFFVRDAHEEVDEMGRHIIAAQDFVKEHDVRSVFGIGGGYDSGGFAVLLVFTREVVDKSKAIAFLPAFNLFRAISQGCIRRGHVFNDFVKGRKNNAQAI